MRATGSRFLAIARHLPDRWRVVAAPLAIVLAYILGGQIGLFLAAALLPLTLLMHARRSEELSATHERDGLTGFLLADSFGPEIDRHLNSNSVESSQTVCLLIDIDRFSDLQNRYGEHAAETVISTTARRIAAALRDEDIRARVGDHRFGVCLKPTYKLDIETCLQLANRLQTAVEEPITMHIATLHPTCSIGICPSSRLRQATSEDLIEGATLALAESRQAGVSSVHAYHDGMRRRAVNRRRSERDALESLNRHEIEPWFQPQICTDTGRITGFEALARWHHPQRGVLSPQDFLPILKASGQLERLASQMLVLSLRALRDWDRAGLNIPSVGVNFSDDELRNPALVDKVLWELDRFDLAPRRLSVEVLESVVAGTPEDIVVRNVNGLAAAGCQVDLDDFGTGHASISSIRRLHVSRLKIDRSFVTRIDQDMDQQRLTGAILTMAEQLGLETLAEGVETPQEHTMLAQLGCNHVQGFGLGRPMPLAETFDWVRTFEAKRVSPPKIGNRQG